MYERTAEMEWYDDVHRVYAKAGPSVGGNKLRTYVGFKDSMIGDFMCNYLNEIYSRKKFRIWFYFRR